MGSRQVIWPTIAMPPVILVPKLTPFRETGITKEDRMGFNFFMKSSLWLVYIRLFLTCLLLSAENITAQEPLYRDPEVVQKELKEKLVIKDEDIAKYPGEVRNYTERGEVYAGLCKLTRDDKERVSYAERASADFAKAIELDPNYYVTYVKRAEFRQSYLARMSQEYFDDIVSDYLEAARLASRTEYAGNAEGYESPVPPLYVMVSRHYLIRAQAAIRDSYVLERLQSKNKQYTYWDDYDAAVEYAKRGATKTNDPWLTSSTLYEKGEKAYELGEYKLALDSYDASEGYWRKNLANVCAFKKMEPCDAVAGEMSDSLIVPRAKLYIKLKKWKTALSYVNRHLSKPNEIYCPQPFLVRAKLYRQLGKITLALADEKTASRLPVPPMTCEEVQEDWK
jgi:tetratricopeptide (TPR) repeat protein